MVLRDRILASAHNQLRLLGKLYEQVLVDSVTINVFESRLMNLRDTQLDPLNHGKTPLHGGELVIANGHAVLTPSDSITCHKMHISRIASIRSSG